MPDRIPINAAKEIANKYDCPQVIILAWDGRLTHVVTFGKTIEDCEQAAKGGNEIKKYLKWPEELCNEQPSRVKRLEQKLKDLQAKYDKLVLSID